MKGIEENDATTRQRRYLRKAKLMNGAIINFCPYMEAKSEDGEVVFAGSRQDAMQLQRNRHFFGRNADVQNGSRAIASILSSGPITSSLKLWALRPASVLVLCLLTSISMMYPRSFMSVKAFPWLSKT